MNEPGKSDSPIVPEKPANKVWLQKQLAAEPVEERGLAKGNPTEQTSCRAQDRERLQHALGGIRQAVRKDRKQRMISLWHHVYDLGRLREAYYALNRKGAAGIDGETWQMYGEDLEANLQTLSERLRKGSYRAQPVERCYIPKSDGRQRPIGVPVLEDKIVQRATAEVLNAVYEGHFKGFSYGFRPGRSQHRALDALYVGLMKRKVNWVLDADIRGCFDAIDHEWLMKFVEHLIADQRVVRHIKKWLKAGVMEDEEVRQVEEGTPQGGSISPLLCNIYLHYVLDLWVDQWRRKQAKGDVIVVRYADDFVMGFQSESEARACLAQLRERLAAFNLELHPEKTRLIEFGRYAAANRKRHGKGKPETFDFLGFTHFCGKTRTRGRFIVGRKTISKRMRAKLKELKDELRRRMHAPIPETGRWLRSVVQGYYNYHAVPRNQAALKCFTRALLRLWWKSLRRRSHKSRCDWTRFYRRIARRWMPALRVMHPYPEHRLNVTT
jgi:group II intron reverse transcriptase/maturase